MNRPLMGVLLIGSLVLTACGGGDDDQVEGPTMTGTGLGAAFGTLDTTSGRTGVAQVTLSADFKDRLSAVVLSTDGKLYAAGLTSKGTDQEIAVTRVDTDGKPDAAFGTAEVASVNVSVNPSTVPTAQLEQARSLVAQSDGKVVVVGTAEHDAAAAGDAAKDTDIVAVRFDATGKLDSTFGQNDVTRIDLGTDHSVDPETFAGADQGYGSTALLNGGIAILGNTTAGADHEDSDFALGGLTSAGTLDPTFGTAGITRVDPDQSRDSARNIKLVGNHILATGLHARRRRGREADPDAHLDNANEDDRGRNLAVLPDGRILYVGSGKIDKDNVQALVVLLSKGGAPETGFGTNGRILTDLGGSSDSWYGLALSTDGKAAYLAGYNNVSADEVKTDNSFLRRLKIS